MEDFELRANSWIKMLEGVVRVCLICESRRIVSIYANKNPAISDGVSRVQMKTELNEGYEFVPDCSFFYPDSSKDFILGVVGLFH